MTSWVRRSTTVVDPSGVEHRRQVTAIRNGRLTIGRAGVHLVDGAPVLDRIVEGRKAWRIITDEGEWLVRDQGG